MQMPIYAIKLLILDFAPARHRNLMFAVGSAGLLLGDAILA